MHPHMTCVGYICSKVICWRSSRFPLPGGILRVNCSDGARALHKVQIAHVMGARAPGLLRGFPYKRVITCDNLHTIGRMPGVTQRLPVELHLLIRVSNGWRNGARSTECPSFPAVIKDAGVSAAAR